jgi:ribosomal protein S18 acetylase RimI-like enzyme
LEESGELRVKRLSESDAAEVEWLLREVWPRAAEYPKKWREARVMGQKQIMGEMNAGLYYFGVRVKGKILGFYKASAAGEIFFGEHQSVHPAHRRCGIAEAMYEHFVKFAEEIGCKKARVNILQSQVASAKLVKKYGFTKMKEYEQIPGMLVHLYEKKIEG